MRDAAVIVPIRSFRDAWHRLAGPLAPPLRERLARSVAAGVLHSAGDRRLVVVTADPEVDRLAASFGARVVAPPSSGLDPAVSAGLAAVEQEGHPRAVVVHADLPLLDADTDPYADVLNRSEDVVIVTDRRRDGTNVWSLPTGAGLAPAYGPGSAERHAMAARVAGLVTATIHHDQLSWDLDEPEDLDHHTVKALMRSLDSTEATARR